MRNFNYPTSINQVIVGENGYFRGFNEGSHWAMGGLYFNPFGFPFGYNGYFPF